MAKHLTRKKQLAIIGTELLILVAVVAGIFSLNYLNPSTSTPKHSSNSFQTTQRAVAQLSNTATSSSTTAIKKTAATSSGAIAIPVPSGPSVRVPILMYHYIGNNPNPADTARTSLSTAPDVFDAQLGVLAQRGYTPISLDTLYASLKGGQLPPKPVVLTFDDGYEDFFYNAWPILMKYHFHATSFIPTGLMNQGYYMTWDQIKQIQASGLVSFEAHSITHPTLTALSYAAQKNEIYTSKQVLESEVGTPVNFFAYPFGVSNQTSWDLVKQAGYFGAVGTWYGTTESMGDVYDWPRVRIGGGMSMNSFASNL